MKQKKPQVKIGLGKLDIPLNWWQHVSVYGGPYHDRPLSMPGVKLAEEIHTPCDIDIPTRDYSTPDLKQLDRGLTRAVQMILAGCPLYVGCYGGKGRTGLFLAVLAKAFGVKNPIRFVRQHYYSHAVETAEQVEYVSTFPINPHVYIAIKKARYKSWKRFWKRGLTRKPCLTNGR